MALAEGAHDHTWCEDPGAEPWSAERSLRAVLSIHPRWPAARVEATRVGVRPMPTSHSAVTLGPRWGRVAAAEIVDGAPDPRLALYRPYRFVARGD